MYSTEPLAPLSEEDRSTLLDLARESIRYRLAEDKTLAVNPNDFSERLRAQQASFVTLSLYSQLRGCIGNLAPDCSLVESVVRNARSAAVSDPRFPRLTLPELLRCEIQISVLGLPQPLHFSSESELITQLRPGVDGLILSEGLSKGTFLPSVWESLPNARDFLRHLKQKAGLPADYWCERIKVERYTTESFSEPNRRSV
jgi:AmmeMemoRadiSam system protein A